jgi:hypothetical protein
LQAALANLRNEKESEVEAVRDQLLEFERKARTMQARDMHRN